MLVTLLSTYHLLSIAHIPLLSTAHIPLLSTEHTPAQLSEHVLVVELASLITDARSQLATVLSERLANPKGAISDAASGLVSALCSALHGTNLDSTNPGSRKRANCSGESDYRTGRQDQRNWRNESDTRGNRDRSRDRFSKDHNGISWNGSREWRGNGEVAKKLREGRGEKQHTHFDEQGDVVAKG